MTNKNDTVLLTALKEKTNELDHMGNHEHGDDVAPYMQWIEDVYTIIKEVDNE